VDRRFAPSSEEEYEALLKKHPRVKKSTTFERDDRFIRSYFKMKEILSSGSLSHLSKRAQCRFLAKEFSIKFGTIKAWIIHHKTPKLVGLLGRLEAERLNARSEAQQARLQYKPRTLEAYTVLLKKHPHVCEHPDSDSRIRYGFLYFEVLETRRTSPEISFTKLSEMYQVPRGAVVEWVRGAYPSIFHQLASSERSLLKHEKKMAQEAYSHRIDPTEAYEILSPLRDAELDVAVLSESVRRFCEMMDDERVVFIELYPHHRRLGPRWLLDVGCSIEENLPEIERFLNNRIEDDSMTYRLGYAGRTLYIWMKRIDTYGYLTLFNDECFYLKSSDRRSLLKKVRDRLNIRGNYVFSSLLRSITDVDDTSRSSEMPVAADLRHDRDHLFGESLRFILDVLGMESKDVGPMLRAIGQQDQIKNPRIIEGEDLLELLSRLFAITASDGHVGDLWSFLGYHEYVPERVEIVKGLVQRLGDVRWSYFYDEDRIAGLRFPHVLGRLMKKIGIPSGDKSIQTYGLPDFILNGSERIRCAYLEEVIPEDGTVVITEKSRCISITRNKVLFDSKKGDQYIFEQKLLNEHIELIKTYGTTIRGQVTGVKLTVGRIRELCDSSDLRVQKIAEHLLYTVYKTPPTLLVDEFKLILSLGLHCPNPRPQHVVWYNKTDRVSSSWALTLSENTSMERWGIIAPPNDGIKRKKLVDWMNQNPDLQDDLC
jgi:phosphopantetheinyl transferase (holo-ACP synthase)